MDTDAGLVIKQEPIQFYENGEDDDLEMIIFESEAQGAQIIDAEELLRLESEGQEPEFLDSGQVIDENDKEYTPTGTRNNASLDTIRRRTIRHLKKAKENVSGKAKNYSCQFCDFRTSSSLALTNHTRRHTGEKPCVCTECGKGFATETGRLNHSKMHKDTLEYECPICGRRFRYKNGLDLHLRVHTGEKPYCCTTCGMNFRQSTHLKVHTRRHTGDTPYCCKFCGRKFAHIGNLRVHVDAIHLQQYTAACSKCGKGFMRRRELEKHEGRCMLMPMDPGLDEDEETELSNL